MSRCRNGPYRGQAVHSHACAAMLTWAQVGKISAAMYTVIGKRSPTILLSLGANSPPAVGVMVYALTIYQLRARAIRLRTGRPYDDRFGPVSHSRRMIKWLS